MTALLDVSPEADPRAPAALASSTAIRTVLVHVRSGREDLPRLRTATALARKFDATVFGVACEAIPPSGAADPTAILVGSWYLAMREQLESDLAQARAVFDAEVQGQRAEWLSVEDLPGPALARISRAADIIVSGGRPLHQTDRYRNVDTAELMLFSGRPVLIAPPLGGELKADKVVVAWKDTRESRRALSDAMPFLVTAQEVVVVEVSVPDDVSHAESRTAAVVSGLKRHGVNARPRVVTADPGRVTIELNQAAQAIGADLLVAGGFGHSRLGEWFFGGVTRELLHFPERFVLLSH
jgi:nucleotide-binding universal stress UspA family protein